MRICFIGRTGVVCTQWIENLRFLGHEVFLVNTHEKHLPEDFLGNNKDIMTYNLYQGTNFHHGIKNNIELLLHHKKIRRIKASHYKETQERLKSILSVHNFDLIFVFYGFDVANELYHLIFNVKTRIPIVHLINYFPSAPIKFVYRYLEHYFYKLFHKYIKARSFYSEEMKQYYKKYINKNEGENIVFIEPYLKKCFANDKNPVIELKRTDDNPYVIYIGILEASKDIRLIKDNLEEDINSLASSKIHVYIRKNKIIKETEFIHHYPFFSIEDMLNGNFSNFLNQFDTTLAIYNEKVYDEKYTTGLCTRFAQAIPGKLPIAVRDSSLFAKNIFIKYNNGFTFSDINDLKQKLRNKSFIQEIRKNSEKNDEFFAFENYSDDFQKLLNKIK